MFELNGVKLETDGGGLWSGVRATVRCTKMIARTITNDFGELRVYFNTDDWDTERHGLIYTDVLWLNELRHHLRKLGFSAEDAGDVDYSEQGMQGDDFVSLDVGKKFLTAWSKLYGTHIN